MTSITTNGFVVVTQVYPQQSGPGTPAFHTTPRVPSVLGKFLQGEPKALGTVQIMIGVMQILYGIVMGIYTTSAGVISGIDFWGGLIYISSGALCVAANNKLNKCLVRGALGMNIISAIAAGIALIIFSVDVAVEFPFSYCHFEDPVYYICQMLVTRSRGISGVLLVFSILELIISICISAFACSAVCDCSTVPAVYSPPYISPTSSHVSSENLIAAPNTYEDNFTHSGPTWDGQHANRGASGI